MGELKDAQMELAELEARAAELLTRRMERSSELAALEVAAEGRRDGDRSELDVDGIVRANALVEALHGIDDERERVQADVSKARLEVQRVLNSRRLRWQALQERRRRWEPLLRFAADFAALADEIEPVRKTTRGYIPRDIDQGMRRLLLYARDVAGKRAELDAAETQLREDGDEFDDDARWRAVGEPKPKQARILDPVIDEVEIQERAGEELVADLAQRGYISPPSS